MDKPNFKSKPFFPMASDLVKEKKSTYDCASPNLNATIYFYEIMYSSYMFIVLHVLIRVRLVGVKVRLVQIKQLTKKL